jgi:hypothetical protein
LDDHIDMLHIREKLAYCRNSKTWRTLGESCTSGLGDGLVVNFADTEGIITCIDFENR